VPESNVFNSFDLPLSESRFLDLLETLVVRREGLCAQGRRTTRLRYAPTRNALPLYIEHFAVSLALNHPYGMAGPYAPIPFLPVERETKSARMALQ